MLQDPTVGICLCVCLLVCLLVCLFVCEAGCLSVGLSFCVFVDLFVCSATREPCPGVQQEPCPGVQSSLGSQSHHYEHRYWVEHGLVPLAA